MSKIVALQEQWCDSQGSVSEVRSKIHMRHDAVAKRERAIAYALSHQVYFCIIKRNSCAGRRKLI